MILSFTLSMPNVGSWDGKWSGSGTLYCLTHNFGKTIKGRDKANQILAEAPYFYRWSDGWMARIDVADVLPQEARRLAKASKGFCGYEWMVESIRSYGKILATHEINELLSK